MTDHLVMQRPGTCDSYEVVGEKWNRPGKLWVVLLGKDLGTNIIACAVYAATKDKADISARLTYNGFLKITDWRWEGNITEPLEIVFDANGVSNAWVW